ncbi:reverse transcriptase domain-containing protein [Tanacetum coccineum]
MTGVPRHTAEHRLNVREGCTPIRQKKRGRSTGKEQSNQEEEEKNKNALQRSLQGNFPSSKYRRSENKNADAQKQDSIHHLRTFNKQGTYGRTGRRRSKNEKEIPRRKLEDEGSTMDDTYMRLPFTKEILPANKRKPRAHPQTNGLVERANRSLGEGIKARLDERSKDWIEELAHVLWSHRTMIKSSNGEIPFSLTYDTEAVIPAEIGMPMLQTMEVDPKKNNEKPMEIKLDTTYSKKKGNTQQFKKQKAKLKWKSITTPGSAAQVSSQVTWSTATTTQVTPGMEANLDPNGKDRTKFADRLKKKRYKLKDCKGKLNSADMENCNL